MKTSDMNKKITSKTLCESFKSKFNKTVNLESYNRETLEDYRNLLRTKINQTESTAKFNDLLTSEEYQRDKYLLGILNTKIQEIVIESKKQKAKDKKKKKKDPIVESIVKFIKEDEEGKAKSITAAADIVNDFTSWMQSCGNYKTKAIIELADNIRANFGINEAETFKQVVSHALDNTLAALTAAREEINNAVASLANGSDVQQMGVDPLAPVPTEGEPAVPANPDALNVPQGDDFAASDAGTGAPDVDGREKR